MIFGIIVGLIITPIFIFLIFWSNKLLNSNKKSLNYSKAKIFEEKISKIMQQWSEKNDCIWIKNSIYEYSKNKFTEIDGILIAKFGIIVLEIKNIKGILEGSAIYKQITKKLKNIEYKINNPLKQNKLHINHLKKISKQDFTAINLIVLSSQTEKIKVTDIPNHCYLVKENLLKDILDTISFLPSTLNKTQIKEIHQNILSAQNNGNNSQKSMVYLND